MRYTQDWQDYELLDAGGGERLERWGQIILIRPDPQAVFETGKKDPRWRDAHARYIRSRTGGGHWETYKPVPQSWQISYKQLRFHLKPMGFKHTGLFPEQAINWDAVGQMIGGQEKPFRVLNLFAYTGGATMACLQAGAQVTHVDASKGMVAWAKDNAVSCGVQDRPVRWLVDDCVKFVERELRRGKEYDGIIMDPPSYGRGPGGEVWKLENEIFPLVQKCTRLLSDRARFFMINSYTAGLSPSVMAYILGMTVRSRFGGAVSADEIGLPVRSTGLILPCGGTAIWKGND